MGTTSSVPTGTRPVSTDAVESTCTRTGVQRKRGPGSSAEPRGGARPRSAPETRCRSRPRARPPRRSGPPASITGENRARAPRGGGSRHGRSPPGRTTASSPASEGSRCQHERAPTPPATRGPWPRRARNWCREHHHADRCRHQAPAPLHRAELERGLLDHRVGEQPIGQLSGTSPGGGLVVCLHLEVERPSGPDPRHVVEPQCRQGPLDRGPLGVGDAAASARTSTAGREPHRRAPYQSHSAPPGDPLVGLARSASRWPPRPRAATAVAVGDLSQCLRLGPVAQRLLVEGGRGRRPGPPGRPATDARSPASPPRRRATAGRRPGRARTWCQPARSRRRRPWPPPARTGRGTGRGPRWPAADPPGSTAARR